MRWIPFLILLYLLLLVQTTVVGMISFTSRWVGVIHPDLLAICAVFIALQVRSGIDSMLAGWALGMALDLTTGGGGGGAATVIGPMAIAYALGSAAVYRVRDAFFRDRPLPQAVLAMLFVAFAHTFWVTAQTLRAGGIAPADYGIMLLQIAAVALYTALLAPIGCFALGRINRWFLLVQAGRSRR